MCEFVCVVDGAGILVSIVVSIPACHAGDPDSIPGREALLLFLLLLLLFAFSLCFCSLLSALYSLRLLFAFALCCLLFCFVALCSFALFVFALHSVLFTLRRCRIS